MTVRYTICATNYNSIRYIRNSVGILASEINDKDEWELVIVDAGSTDGSLEYMRNLAEEQSNVRVIVKDGVSIGRGRELAVQEAVGKILIQIMDLDAEYHEDGRLFEITAFYESILEDEGPVQLSAGAYFSTKKLMNELGGWKDLVANEETELKRRALQQGKLRFCPVYLYKQHSDEKDFIGRVRRFYYNSYSKLQSGVGFWYMLFYWIRHAIGLKPRLGALVVFPVAWVNSTRNRDNNSGPYSKHDDYIMNFQKSVFNQHPEIWLDPPQGLKDYIITDRWEHISEDS